MTIYNRVVAPRFDRPVNEEAVTSAIPDARHCIAELARLLDGRDWMARGALSLADMQLTPHLSLFALAPEGTEILAAHPNLEGCLRASRHAGACRQRPGTSYWNG